MSPGATIGQDHRCQPEWIRAPMPARGSYPDNPPAQGNRHEPDNSRAPTPISGSYPDDAWTPTRGTRSSAPTHPVLTGDVAQTLTQPATGSNTQRGNANTTTALNNYRGSQPGAAELNTGFVTPSTFTGDLGVRGDTVTTAAAKCISRPPHEAYRMQEKPVSVKPSTPVDQGSKPTTKRLRPEARDFAVPHNKRPVPIEAPPDLVLSATPPTALSRDFDAPHNQKAVSIQTPPTPALPAAPHAAHFAAPQNRRAVSIQNPPTPVSSAASSAAHFAAPHNRRAVSIQTPPTPVSSAALSAAHFAAPHIKRAVSIQSPPTAVSSAALPAAHFAAPHNKRAVSIQSPPTPVSSTVLPAALSKDFAAPQNKDQRAITIQTPPTQAEATLSLPAASSTTLPKDFAAPHNKRPDQIRAPSTLTSSAAPSTALPRDFTAPHKKRAVAVQAPPALLLSPASPTAVQTEESEPKPTPHTTPSLEDDIGVSGIVHDFSRLTINPQTARNRSTISKPSTSRATKMKAEIPNDMAVVKTEEPTNPPTPHPRPGGLGNGNEQKPKEIELMGNLLSLNKERKRVEDAIVAKLKQIDDDRASDEL